MGHIFSHVQKWKLLFIIEGLPGFCLGAFCLYWLPDRPLKNSRFNEQENEVAVARYRRDSYDRAGKIQKRHVIWTITDWKLYLQGAYLPLVDMWRINPCSRHLYPHCCLAVLNFRLSAHNCPKYDFFCLLLPFLRFFFGVSLAGRVLIAVDLGYTSPTSANLMTGKHIRSMFATTDYCSATICLRICPHVRYVLQL